VINSEDNGTAEDNGGTPMGPSKFIGKVVAGSTTSDSSGKSSQPSVVRVGPDGKPVSILKKKSKYEEGQKRVHTVRVKDKLKANDSVRIPLMLTLDDSEITDSQV